MESVQLGDMDVEGLLDLPPQEETSVPADFGVEQQNNPCFKVRICLGMNNSSLTVLGLYIIALHR